MFVMTYHPIGREPGGLPRGQNRHPLSPDLLISL